MVELRIDCLQQLAQERVLDSLLLPTNHQLVVDPIQSCRLLHHDLWEVRLARLVHLVLVEPALCLRLHRLLVPFQFLLHQVVVQDQSNFLDAESQIETVAMAPGTGSSRHLHLHRHQLQMGRDCRKYLGSVLGTNRPEVRLRCLIARSICRWMLDLRYLQEPCLTR